MVCPDQQAGHRYTSVCGKEGREAIPALQRMFPTLAFSYAIQCGPLSECSPPEAVACGPHAPLTVRVCEPNAAMQAMAALAVLFVVFLVGRFMMHARGSEEKRSE